MTDEMVSVRYMVDDVDRAIDFYTDKLGFELGQNASPAFAEVVRGRLRLLLAGPKSSAGRCRTAASPSLAGGTAFISSSTTSMPKSIACAPQA